MPMRQHDGDPEGIQFIVTHPIILSSMMLDFVQPSLLGEHAHADRCPRYPESGRRGIRWLSAAQSAGQCWRSVISQVHELRKQGPLFLGRWSSSGWRRSSLDSRLVCRGWILLAITEAADAVSTIIRNTIRSCRRPTYPRR